MVSLIFSFADMAVIDRLKNLCTRQRFSSCDHFSLFIYIFCYFIYNNNKKKIDRKVCNVFEQVTTLCNTHFVTLNFIANIGTISGDVVFNYFRYHEKTIKVY